MAMNTYYFSATGTAQTIVPVNPYRRRLNIQCFGLPEEADAHSIWVNVVGTPAVAFQCMQLVPGTVWQYGGSEDVVESLMLRFQSCPTGAISVITSAGTHRGYIEEYTT